MSNYVAPEVEKAAYHYLVSRLPDWLAERRVYKGIEGDMEESFWTRPKALMEVPCVVLRCESSDPVLPNYHGAREARLEIEVHSNRFDGDGRTLMARPGPLHIQRCRDIIDRFLTTTIEQDLAALYLSKEAGEQFFVKKVIPGSDSIRSEGKRWITQFSLDFKECAHLATDQIPTP